MYDRLSRRLDDAPRVLVLGAERNSLGTPLDGLAEQIDRLAETGRLPARGARLGYRAYRDAARMLRQRTFEAIHLADARLALAGVALKRRYSLPVSVSIDAAAVARGTPPARLTLMALARLDQGFVSDEPTARLLRRRARRLPLVMTPPVAERPPSPSDRALSSMSRLLGDLTPGRVIIGLPWPADADQLRWYRDAVVPLLTGNPVCLILGAPSRRHARLIVGAIGLREHYRVHTGVLTSDVLSAAARCADVFLLPGEPRQYWLTDDLVTAMAASRVPLVVGGGVRTSRLSHEDNGFTAQRGDPMSVVSTLNQLLCLPAVQRHYLGEQFADYTLDSWPAEPAAQIYLERFSALVGRPQIPAELRAA